MTDTETTEECACKPVLNLDGFSWWHKFRTHFPRFHTNFIHGGIPLGIEMNNFYSDVFSIIAEEMSKDYSARNHE